MRKCLGTESLFFLVGTFLLSGSPVFGDTISVSNPNDGFRSSYTLTAVCNGNLCDVTLKIDTSSVGGTYTDISNVDFKIETTDTLAGTLTAPTAGWSTITSSLSSVGAKDLTATVRYARPQQAILQIRDECSLGLGQTCRLLAT